MVADCMPVFFADEDASVVGVAHAGWRGLAAGVLDATIDAMGVAPEKLVAWLGPAIGPRVYEVGEDVHAAFPEKEAFAPNRPGHWLMDLYAIARARLALVDAHDLERGQHGDHDQRGDQQERPPEQRHFGVPSGTKT